MKYLTIIALLVTVNVIGQSSVTISNRYTLKDSKAKVVDSVGDDELFYVHNYKKVPIGVYSDTAIWPDGDYRRVIIISVFHNRKRIIYISFVQTNGWFYDSNIDIDYIKKHLK